VQFRNHSVYTNVLLCIHFANPEKVVPVIKKLVRHGNSRALVIDKPILELLNITDETEIEIITDGTSLTMRPLRSDADRRRAFEVAAEDAVARYGDVFKKLAE
jgi:antitoxin MazE